MKTFTDDEIQDLTDRVFLIIEKLDTGKLKIATHLVDGFRASLELIRLQPDGRVDPATVDGRIKAMSLAIMGMNQREDAKKAISLAKIQTIYFDFLFKQFGGFYKQMIKAKANPGQMARVLARDSDFCKHLQDVFPELSTTIHEFWESVGDSATCHLQDSSQLKAAFAGDLFPAHWENAVSTAGLYVDTIVLPCPFSRITPLEKVMPPQELAAVLMKHVLTAMTYRELAIADVEPPLVLIAPDPNDLGTENKIVLAQNSESLTCKHAEYLFGRPFESLDHLTEFCGELSTVDQVLSELKGRDRLIFDSEWGRDPRVQLEKAMQAPAHQMLHEGVAGNTVLTACAGRMPQAFATQANSRRVGGTPLICADTSWLYYTWMLEYEGAPVTDDPHARQTMHVTRALTSEMGNNLEWLGRVPPETILEIRKQGLAEEVRSILGNGITELVGINPNNYFRTADQVVDNLERAFRKHQKELYEAKQKKLKLYGIDVPACLAVGGVAIAAALVGSPALGVASGVLGMAGLPNLKDIKSKFTAIADEDQARKISPTGLLFRHSLR
jgi:hypothetical protein